jgi:hypothetical protein
MLGTGGAAAQAATWNHGYNGWWPHGFGNPPVTVAAATKQCSVTAYGPTFRTPADSNGAWTQFYGAGSRCQGGVGLKTLTVSDQVLGPAGKTWFTITGSAHTVGLTRVNPVHLIYHLTAVLGHVYRSVAHATIVAPNGHAGCSLHVPPDCNANYHLRAISKPLAP